MTAEDESFSQLVVIGSSAGGIEALSTLVATLPQDFAAPIVIAQHLDPNRISHLAAILAQRSSLPVRSVTDRARLEPGVVFVVPANHDVEITDHEVRLSQDHARRARPSVDLLLSSAAQVFGENLVAVILTGSGSDGAAGAREVKRAGGTVVIQNPDTASFPSMPLSLAPTVVDVVANLEAIGPLLQDLLSGSYGLTQPGDQTQLRSFLDQLREQSGIDFTSYKLPTIMRRLRRRMAATNSDKLGAYLRYLQRHPDEYPRLINSFLIKVTEFFRDPELFDHLRQHILPELAAAARERHELRIWSAGCATGEEAYSLAILVSELLGEDLEKVNVRIFATDLDADAIAFARRGVYPAAAVAALPPELVARYFDSVDGAFEVKKQVRNLVVFGQHDLAQRAPFPRIDLILCRNVLIYFTPELQRRALQLFAFSLRDGCHLVLGKAETVSPLAEYFALEQARLKIYRRVGARVVIPAARIRTATPSPTGWLPVKVPRPAAPDADAEHGLRGSERARPPIATGENLLLRLPVGTVLVDRRYDILLINNTARRLFGIHSSAIGEDFLHLVQYVPLHEIRVAIDAAFHGETMQSIYELSAPHAAPGERRFLQTVCYPEHPDGEQATPKTAMIVVVDVTAIEQRRRGLEERVAALEQEIAGYGEQLRGLTEANRQLLAANQELADANAELHSANEELLVSNEEVQAATEEVETLNEELQATNEELETLNEELQATVEELNTTNDDLEARSIELQELAASLEEQRRASDAERARLAAIVISMAEPLLVVDREGAPVLANEAYSLAFGEAAGWVAADEREQPLPPEATPQQRAARGESFTMEITVTAPDGARRWFEVKGQPVRREGIEEGGAVVFHEITDRSLRRLQDEFMAIASHELRTPLTATSGYLQMLRRQLRADPENERARHFAAIAIEQVRRMAGLVDELLDVSRLRTGRLNLTLAPVDLVPLVRQVAETAQVLAQGQTIQLDVEADRLIIQGDAARLEQTVLNLLTNAVTYAPGTERIDFRLRQVDGAAELHVRDYGPGIPEADQEAIFSRFHRLQHHGEGLRGGLGLGLYIAHEIITAHGGEIEVVSAAGENTTFTIRLPLADVAEPPPGQAAE